jgi:hypothetical protein
MMTEEWMAATYKRPTDRQRERHSARARARARERERERESLDGRAVGGSQVGGVLALCTLVALAAVAVSLTQLHQAHHTSLIFGNQQSLHSAN